MAAPLPVATQPSRAGLITTLVLFVVLFAGATLVAIHFNTQWTAAVEKGKKDVEELLPAANPTVVNIPEVKTVIDAGRDRHLTGIEEAIRQRNEIAKVIIGNNATGSPEAIRSAAHDQLEVVKKNLADEAVTTAKTVVPTLKLPAVEDNNLLATMADLSAQIVTLSKAVLATQATSVVDKAAMQKEIDAAKAAQTAAEADAATAKQAKAAADTKYEADLKKQSADIGNTNDAAKKVGDDAAIKINIATTAQTNAEAALEKVTKELARTQARLAQFHVNPNRAILQPAGMVVRVPGDNTVFINLGEGRQISPGLTFEVYDKKQGLPSLTATNVDNPDELVPGKASIEVVRILPNTSECRIIREDKDRGRGKPVSIVEGDLILNLLYNTHTKFTFAVLGDFDLSESGQPQPGDIDVIKRLITQWGGAATDSVGVNTDFVVLGKDPIVNPLPETGATAVDIEHHEAQVRALENFKKVLDLAGKYNVPILNQNRFLYFIGYFDQKKR